MTPIHILMAEDNEGDVLLTREAFAEAKIVTHFSVVKDGKEAIDFLACQGKYEHESMPDLLLLDVNLPRKNGHEVLQYVKGDAHLQHIPVVMLSTSSSPKDIKLALTNQARCFLTKPINMSEFLGALTNIENLSLRLVNVSATRNSNPGESQSS